MSRKQKRTLSLAVGIERLISVTKRKRDQRRPATPVIVLVAGGSASGKTSQVAQKLFDACEGTAIIISMDDYYRGATYDREHDLNFDQPEAIDITLLIDSSEFFTKSYADM